MNLAKRNKRERMEAKVTGMTAGEADVRICMFGGRLLSLSGSRNETTRNETTRTQRA